MTGHLRLLLLTLALASPALAQPAGGGVAPSIDGNATTTTTTAPPLILFSMSNRPVNHPIATVAEQVRLQTAMMRRILQRNDGSESDLFRRLQDSIFSVSRAVLNNEIREQNSELSRALTTYVNEDMASLLNKRHSNYKEGGGFGPRPIMYDTARATVDLLQGADGAIVDRAAAVDALRGIVGAVPYEGGLGATDRQFMTQFLVHDLFVKLYPQLPRSGGHKFKDYIDLTQVDGDLGDAIQCLAKGFTLGGRKKSIARLHTAIDALEASTP